MLGCTYKKPNLKEVIEAIEQKAIKSDAKNRRNPYDDWDRVRFRFECNGSKFLIWTAEVLNALDGRICYVSVEIVEGESVFDGGCSSAKFAMEITLMKRRSILCAE